MIERQPKIIPKTRWSGFLTRDNFDWLCHVALAEDRSIANLLNRIIRAYRDTAERSTGNNGTGNGQK